MSFVHVGKSVGFLLRNPNESFQNYSRMGGRRNGCLLMSSQGNGNKSAKFVKGGSGKTTAAIISAQSQPKCRWFVSHALFISGQASMNSPKLLNFELLNLSFPFKKSLMKSPMPCSSIKQSYSLVTVSAKNHKHKRPSPQDGLTDEIGGLGFAVLDALTFKSPVQSSTNLRELKDSKGGEFRAQVESSFSGSDVLIALQKAAIRKSNSKGKKGKNTKGNQSREDLIDYNDIRALNIRSDWGDRLAELEHALEEMLR